LVTTQGGNFPSLPEEMSAFKAALAMVLRKEMLGFKMNVRGIGEVGSSAFNWKWLNCMCKLPWPLNWPVYGSWVQG